MSKRMMVNARDILVSRVYNREEKRVSNALYALCKMLMFSESHMPGIQTLTNENARFK